MKKNVIDYLLETAEEYPDKVAFVDENKEMTFAQVLSEAQRVAGLIYNKCGMIHNMPIMTYMEKSCDMLCTYLGIAYSGNYYCPIDIGIPKQRVNAIIDTLQPIMAICDRNAVEVLGEEVTQVLFNDVSDEYEDKQYKSNREKVLDIDPLYVLFTSGSTGVPKGVTISHRGVIDYAEWLKDKFDFDSDTVFGNQAPFYFDNSILDIYSTIKNGSTMVIIPEKLFLSPFKLIEYLNDKKVNTIFWVPSALIFVANSGVMERTKPEYLKNVLFCGEVMPNKQLNTWRRFIPEARYVNMYGPTEITDVCTYYIVNREFADDEPLPIGQACENMEIIVLNEENQPVSGGEKGELCVRGCGVSMGYYNNSEKTKEAFIQNPINGKYRDIIYRTGDIVQYNEYGEILYLSRKDFQIKHQGHRIELGEIETALSSLPGVQTGCAVYIDGTITVCYMNGGDLGEKDVYKHLKGMLPKYMVPGRIVRLDKFPYNLNGKIDRVELSKLLKNTEN